MVSIVKKPRRTKMEFGIVIFAVVTMFLEAVLFELTERTGEKVED